MIQNPQVIESQVLETLTPTAETDISQVFSRLDLRFDQVDTRLTRIERDLREISRLLRIKST